MSAVTLKLCVPAVLGLPVKAPVLVLKLAPVGVESILNVTVITVSVVCDAILALKL